MLDLEQLAVSKAEVAFGRLQSRLASECLLKQKENARRSQCLARRVVSLTARGFVDQATEAITELAPLTTYQEITQHYRLSRRTLPLPHPQLTKTQETTLRLLQSNTFPHPIRMHLLFPYQFEAQCKYCAQPGTLRHIILECEKNPNLPPLKPLPHPPEQWETLLSSSHLADQLLLAERAVVAKTTHGYP